MNRRIERVSFTLQRELGPLIDESISDPRLAPMTSVTRVECTADLATAHIYISVLGDRAAQDGSLEALESAAGYLRKEVGARIQIRHVPRFQFHLDPALQEAAGMFELMDRVAQQDRELGRERDGAPSTEEAGGDGARDTL